jgi:hypothetical protein
MLAGFLFAITPALHGKRVLKRNRRFGNGVEAKTSGETKSGKAGNMDGGLSTQTFK